MEAPRLLTLSPLSTTPSLKPSETFFPISSTSSQNPSRHYSNPIHCCIPKKPQPRSATTSSRTSGGRAKSSWNWSSNAEEFGSNRFKFEDEWREEGDEEDYGSDSRFGWRDSPKRKWWSEIDDDSRGGNGVIEDVIDNVWFFKVLRPFGWLLPAVLISTLLASGPKAFLMALAVPLGQSAVSFAIDKLFGRSWERPKPKPRAKRKPFARAASSVEIDEEELDEGSETPEGRQGYQSWVATDNSSVKQEDQGKAGFGGWDELDRRERSDKGTTRRQRQTTRGPPGQGVAKGKVSRRGRHRDKPLLLRLLISVFPFLGSWTKLL